MRKSDRGFIGLGVGIYLVSLLFLACYGGGTVDMAECTLTLAGMCVGVIFVVIGFGESLGKR